MIKYTHFFVILSRGNQTSDISKFSKELYLDEKEVEEITLIIVQL